MQREALKTLTTLDLQEGNMPYGLCLYQPTGIRVLLVFWPPELKIVITVLLSFADTEDEGVIKGSARSISGLHIRDV